MRGNARRLHSPKAGCNGRATVLHLVTSWTAQAVLGRGSFDSNFAINNVSGCGRNSVRVGVIFSYSWRFSSLISRIASSWVSSKITTPSASRRISAGSMARSSHKFSTCEGCERQIEVKPVPVGLGFRPKCGYAHFEQTYLGASLVSRHVPTNRLRKSVSSPVRCDLRPVRLTARPVRC